jgi:HECT-domain (ubiquitin-transferase)
MKGLLFSVAKYTASEVIDVLCLYYEGYDVDSSIESQEAVFSVCPKSQERRGILVDIIRERGQDGDDFLKDFVWFITGSSYIQIQQLKQYSIIIEFSSKELTSDDSYPVGHTCEQVLTLPGNAYFGDRAKLERLLDESIAHCKVQSFSDK